jgi:putative sigma-54 modulation protein
MKIKVQSIHFDADQKLLDFIEEKVDKLFQFYDHIIDSEVFLRLDKSDNTENKITEIKIYTPGKTLFAKEQCKTFEEATDNAVEALRRQITRHKEKQRGE